MTDSDDFAFVIQDQKAIEENKRKAAHALIAKKKRIPYTPPKYVLRDFGSFEVQVDEKEGGFGKV